MKATIAIYTNDGSKNAIYPIKLIITHKQRTKRITIARSHIDDWDMLHQLPKPSHDEFEQVYGRIMKMRSMAITEKFRNLNTIDAAVSFFDEKKEKKLDFFSFAEQEIERMVKMGREGNAFAYRFSVDQLKLFAPELEFHQIDRFFLENFKQYKKLNGLKNTSIRTYLYEIRAIYNKAVRMGICEDSRPFTGLFVDLQVRKRRQKNEYIDAEGLRKLAALKNISQAQQLAIDLSLLQFYLCGADLVDVYNLKKSQIVNGRVYLHRQKLGVKSYEFDVALVASAKKIIEKYQEPAGEYVFGFRRGRVAYNTFRSTHNVKLKRIQANHGLQLRPKGGNLTSKVIRHSFATIAKFNHIDVDVIRELMGHERNDIDTVYKDKYPEMVRDQAQKKIFDHVFGKN